MIAITMLGGRSIAPLGQVVGLLMQFQNTRMSLETLDKLMAQPVERPDAAAFIHSPELQGDIEFRDVLGIRIFRWTKPVNCLKLP